MIKSTIQQQLFDKYAPDPSGGTWNIQRLADTITDRQSPSGDILRKWLFRLDDTCIKTRICKEGIYEFIVANDCWLFINDPDELKKGVTWRTNSVAWANVTDQDVEQCLNNLTEYFKTLN